MMFGLLSSNDDNEDIPPLIRGLLIFVAIVVVFALVGCSTVPPSPMTRHAPTADMVRLDPLPKQTDPTLGGLYQGYVNAAQHDRQCMTRLTELQDWINAGETK